MKDAKPKPRQSAKLPVREPAKPLEPPATQPPDDHPIFNLVGPALAAQTPTTHPPPTYHPPPTTQPVAPERDFVRVPNSVVRNALPAGLFKGESKKTYDALYQRTRGAVTPRRVLRATLADVMAWAGVSHNTLKAHLKHLSRVGLVQVNYVRGDNTGAEYEVLTPEEAPPTTHHPHSTHQPATNQNLAPPTSQNLVGGGWGQTVDSKGINESDNTSFNTNTDKLDDEAAPLARALSQAERELTGKVTSDASKWEDLALVLTMELKIAAGRTTVSSVPAFLAEHLRRRLWKKEKRQIEAETAAHKESAHASQIDASQCPDCFGTGMYYPEGFEKGVARCPHSKLSTKSER